MRGIEVDVSNNFHQCFLDTNYFHMRYQTAQQPWAYGNVSCMNSVTYILVIRHIVSSQMQADYLGMHVHVFLAINNINF